MRHATLILAILAAGLLAVAGPGTRLDLWTFRTGLPVVALGSTVTLTALRIAPVQDESAPVHRVVPDRRRGRRSDDS